MKVVISLKKLHTASNTRGIGVYTRELVASLQKKFPKDKFIPTSHAVGDLGADLIHFPYFDPFFLTLNFSRNIKTVVTIHDLIPLRFPERFPSGIRGRLKWLVQKYLVSKVDMIITDSNASKQDIERIIGIDSKKIAVIPLGPNKAEKVPVRMTKKIIESHHLPEKYLLYVGDINWNKNVTGLIEAFSKLKDDDLHLVLVGKVFTDKPNIKEYKEIVSAISQSGKADKILTLGYVPSHHLSVIYSHATLYVQPSWYEGFGLPILEAMKFGCPVASSSLGSLPEIGGDAVAYFDPGKNMVKVIESLLLDQQKLEQLKQAGLIQASKFNWDQTAILTHQIYEQVIANSL